VKILVCVRQVIDPVTCPMPDPASGALLLDEQTIFRLNRYDAYAGEEALRIKDTHPGVSVTALSLGPERVVEVIRRAMGMGADHGIHLETGPCESVDPAAVAFPIAEYLRRKEFDLILTGVMSEDWQRGAVGPMIAAFLDLPLAVAVTALKLELDEREIFVERELDGGWREELALPLPALLTVQSGALRPRYPSLSHLLRARGAEIEKIAAPLVAEQVAVVGYELPRRQRAGVVLDGTPREKAAQLWHTLRRQGVLKG